VVAAGRLTPGDNHMAKMPQEAMDFYL
jgi:hypothetical protein